MKIVWTGAAGFIAGYTIEELLNHGHEVVGIDNYSKYGKVEKSYDKHPKYTFIEGDAKDVELMKKACEDADVIVSGAAMIGGISYFHEYAYELMAENERNTASAFDAAIWAFREKKLKKIVVMSSSMVYESTDQFPTPEGAIQTSPPPISTYGFQKLACEYFARGGWEQYQLPYTIIRPFNCVGIGEKRALSDKDVYSGNVKLAMSHVVPDLVQKIVKGQDPLHILGEGNQVRHYTYGGDLAEGIRLCIETDKALNQEFNISTAQSTTVMELAEKIWQKLNGDKPFKVTSDKPFQHDVQKRIPDTAKAKQVLGYEAKTSLDDMLDEVIPWIKEQVEHGNI
jgi:nucleoside-diphosphate-sugar epimerase